MFDLNVAQAAKQSAVASPSDNPAPVSAAATYYGLSIHVNINLYVLNLSDPDISLLEVLHALLVTVYAYNQFDSR